jgi:hypothetical protein
MYCRVLGYTRPADGGNRYTISREKHVQVDGKFADAVLGDFGTGVDRSIVALEGKGPKNPLDRPFIGRRTSTVDQGYGLTPAEFALLWLSPRFGASRQSRRPPLHLRLKPTLFICASATEVVGEARFGTIFTKLAGMPLIIPKRCRA